MLPTIKELIKQQGAQIQEIEPVEDDWETNSDSDEEEDEQPRTKRPRKHRFKTFAQRVAEVSKI